MHDSGAESCGRRPEGRCTSVLGNKTRSPGDSADDRCKARELRGAQVGNICPVQNVEGFTDELQTQSLFDCYIAGHARIHRNCCRLPKSVSWLARRAVRLGVAIVIEIEIHQPGIRQTGLHSQNPTELPTAKECLPRFRQAVCVIQVPEATQDESVSHVLHAWAAVRARVEGIGEKKSIIGTARVEPAIGLVGGKR